MELKHVIPNMEKTFGQLEYAGEGKVEQRRINGRQTILSRSYNLYSTIQRADDIVVVLPAEAGEKHFEAEDKIRLLNPKITAEGYKIGNRGFTNYIMHAGDMVIVQNPTMSSKPAKSNYQPKQKESDGAVDAVTTEEINSFLETFFKLYPKATDKELAYYVSNDALPVINKDYVFAELLNPIYTMKDNKVTVSVTVKYLDQETKVTQLSQYKLVLEKNENWKIIEIGN